MKFPASVKTYMSSRNPAKDVERCDFYALRVEQEYEELREWLPQSATHIVDIGCGLGGIDVHFMKHYPEARLTLVDGGGDQANRTMGYREGTRAWADVRIAHKLVVANHPKADVTGCLADPTATYPGCDLLVSLKSWAHHYPLGVYLPLALRSLVPGGTLILDIRRGTSGREELERAGFALVGVVQDKTKAHRVVMRREG